MNKKIVISLSIIILIIIIIVYIAFSKGFSTNTEEQYSTEKAQVTRQTIVKTLTNSGEVLSGLTEKIELHASYYFSELCVEKNAYVQEGENMLKYTNGTYLTAPYDLVVISYSIPDEGAQITNSHYIEVKTTETLNMTISVSEANMDIAKLGQEVEVVVNAFEDTPYKGIITSIDETGTYGSGKSTFNATITFMNDGNIKLGMSGYWTIVLQEAKDVLAVPVEAVEEDGGKYVVVVNNDGTLVEKTVQIGISNANYVEIVSGLEEGETLQYINVATDNTAKASTSNNSSGQGDSTSRDLMRALDM